MSNSIRTKLWVGVGASVLLGSGAAGWADTQASDDLTQGPDSLMLARADQGGESGETGRQEGGEGGEAGHQKGGEGGEAGHQEGGEGGEGGEGSAAADPFSVFAYLNASAGGEGGEGGEAGQGIDASNPGIYYTNLAMMKGHLAIARELYQEGAQTASQPHFGHPLQEHYEPLESAFETRGVAPFEDTLRALVDQAREGGEWSAHADAYQAALQAIDVAMQDVDAELRGDVAFQSRVQLALLRQAKHEYEEAVENGQFVNVLEYQDGRGFMLTARALLEQQAELFRASDEATLEELMAAYDEAMAAWPSAEAPQAPVMSRGELSSSTFRLESLLGRY